MFDLKSAPPTDTSATAPTQIIETPIFGGPQTPSPDFGPVDLGFGGAAGAQGGPGRERIYLVHPQVLDLKHRFPNLLLRQACQARVLHLLLLQRVLHNYRQRLVPLLNGKKKILNSYSTYCCDYCTSCRNYRGPFLSEYLPIPNPAKQKIVELENRIKQQEAAIQKNIDIENKMQE